MIYTFRSGQSLLALVIMIGGIILAAGAALAVVTSSFVNSTYGYESAEQAEAIATAGAEDALLQLDRNNQFSNTSGYLIAVGSSTATVSVNQNSPSFGLATILSEATIAFRTREIQVVVSLNPTTGQASVVSWNELQ